MALKLWASSTANAIRISCSSSRPDFPAFSIFRSFSSGKKILLPAVSALHATERCSSRMRDTSPLAWREFAETGCIVLLSACRQSVPACSVSVFTDNVIIIEGLKYTGSHEWVKQEGSVATVGITDHAQLPESGAAVAKGSSFGAVESVKATSDVNSPVSGEVIEVNTKLTETPGLVIPAAPPPS
ncbi:hypothetical protein B296_00036698 [Ensete ventricosum]|uniref:Lipoyl-binding domain-containing protein n=1 Tax=Ensete ventricosum TaxID=4639 RepID=A0A426Y6Q0_ENSVE|nr:hypothetical protein B296_00036698 [Ensete ventricosum]